MAPVAGRAAEEQPPEQAKAPVASSAAVDTASRAGYFPRPPELFSEEHVEESNDGGHCGDVISSGVGSTVQYGGSTGDLDSTAASLVNNDYDGAACMVAFREPMATGQHEPDTVESVSATTLAVIEAAEASLLSLALRGYECSDALAELAAGRQKAMVVAHQAITPVSASRPKTTKRKQRR